MGRSDEVKLRLSRAGHRALFKALGCTDDELKRPFIGVVNSYNELIPGHLHLMSISSAVKAGIRDGGGLPFEFFTIGICDGIAMGHIGMHYSLPSRDLIADTVEVMVEAYRLDGMVLISNCDKITPGMIMAALRVNIPAIIITGGPMLGGVNKTHLVSVFEGVGKVSAGMMTEEELKELEECACPGAGSCAGMFTANSMSCLVEALGMALPYNGSIPAVDARRIRLAKQTGRQIMYLVKNNIKPRDIVCIEAFENAIAVDMAIGCSTNTVLHLPAIAKEAGIDLDLSTFDRISRKTPNLCQLAPAGRYLLEDFDRAGGIPALMHELDKAGLIHTELTTSLGKKIKDIIKDKKIKDTNVIRPITAPYRNTGGIVILYGNIAPEGSVLKESAISEKVSRFTGRAVVYDCEEEAVRDIVSKNIEDGSVIVIRYEGPKGGPGMREMLTATSAIAGIGKENDIALVTDGRFSGGSRGIVVGHVSPEAALNGPISVVKTGDIITIDIVRRKIQLELEDEEINRRLKNVKHPKKEIPQRSYLKRYIELVSSVKEGGILGST